MRSFSCIVLAIGFLFSAYAEERGALAVPEGKVYVYKNSGGQDREIEVYFPEGHDTSKKPGPGIIMFHGGGWGGGSRTQFKPLCHYFASRGVVATLHKRSRIFQTENGWENSPHRSSRRARGKPVKTRGCETLRNKKGKPYETRSDPPMPHPIQCPCVVRQLDQRKSGLQNRSGKKESPRGNAVPSRGGV